jgi:polyphosphate kinase
MQFADFLGLVADAHPDLRFEPLQPAIPARFQEPEPVMAVIARGDALLHHPYESFEPVVRFVEEAADDPDVLAIKQTFYRAGGDSPFIRALCRAAESGKQVTVLVEIKARFDEANNIAWGRRLADSGVQVVYGFVGLKTHCKVTLVVRREAGGIRRYVHLGTGNYNPQTARQYTDLSFFTCRDEFAEDASALFNLLTGYAEPPHWKRLVIAPYGLQERILALVAREAEQARAGKPARIVAKMNALVDPMVIRALYAASQAGVEIDLLVRGICCLRPGVSGVSDRIRVTSVLGRFLEHSRIFAFGEGERAECWLSSADWMPRNFQRRVEAMFPVEDPALRTRIVEEILGGPLRPDAKAWRLTATGAYERLVPAGEAVDSQALLLEAARRAANLPGRPPGLRAAPPA